MNRLVYFLGAVAFLAASLTLMDVGDAIVRLCDALIYDVTATRTPLPDALHQTLFVAVSAALLSIGLCLMCFGMMLRCERHAITALGRFLHVATAVAIIAAAAWSVWATFSTQQNFFGIAALDTAPNVDDFNMMIETNSRHMRIGFMILAAAGGLSLAVALFGFRRVTDCYPGTAHIASWLATFGAILACTIAFSVMMFFVRAHAANLEALLTDESGLPKAHELAEHVSGVINKSMFSFVLLACIASAHMLTAFLAPSPIPMSTSDRQA